MLAQAQRHPGGVSKAWVRVETHTKPRRAGTMPDSAYYDSDGLCWPK